MKSLSSHKIYNMGRKTNVNYDNLYLEYKEGKPIRQIAKENNIFWTTVYAAFNKRQYKLDFTNKELRHFKYNDNYFKVIDTEDKAYFLGLLYADGYLNSINRVGIKLMKEDSYILTILNNFICPECKISEIKNASQLYFTSKILNDSLRNLGFTNNKTYDKPHLMNLSDEMFRHFLRGYFDGDGTIYQRTERKNQWVVNIASLNTVILNDIKLKLQKIGIEGNIYTEKRKGKKLKIFDKYSDTNEDISRYTLISHKDRMLLYRYLYDNSTLYLLRKYKKYKNYYDNIVLILGTKNPEIVQRIEAEPFILKNINFKSWKIDVDIDKLKHLYFIEKLPKTKIAKILQVDRGTVYRCLDNIKEYNASTSVRHPKKDENIC
jgi:hypothetical protein